ncbi:MAG: hypothetical protein D6796_08395 [Caldilineae bacterium]|nr:MAG: hypothetical protein D6796_08395 [Caldilineae bacterium]
MPYSAEPTLQNLRRALQLLETLAPYLPAHLLARIASDPHATSLEGEHRLVAVLFANVRGLDQIAEAFGPGREEAIVNALNRYFTAIVPAIHRFDGVINKIDLNETGNKILAFFGAPLAHEDDPERAVRAALAMQQAFADLRQTLPDEIGLPDLQLSQQIGITYGYVFAGYVGTSWRREYTVMGDEVNLAARLMTIAEPDTILVSSNVRRKVETLFAFAPRGEVILKGKSDPVPVFSILGPRTVPEAPHGLPEIRAPLVGRQREWDRLLSALIELLRGRGQIVSLIGEAGLGKTRLIAEMRPYIADEKRLALRWVEGHCLSYTEVLSYHPFQQVVRQLLNLPPEDGPWESWIRLQETLQNLFPSNQIADTLPYLAHFLDIPVGEAYQDKMRHLDAEALQRRTFVAIRTLIEGVTQSSPSQEAIPLVVVLEDIHWLDKASLALLEYLLPLVNRIPLMFLLVYRPERHKACWQVQEKVAREFPHCASQITLRPLSSTDSHTLLTSLIPLEKWSDEILDLILDRAEGNPLFLEEVVQSLIDDHVLVKENGNGWKLRSTPEAVRVPDTLQGVIMSRLDRLEEPCRWALQIASVIGRTFSYDLLAQIIASQRGNKPDYCLIQLQQQGLIYEVGRTPELVYAFKHALIQEVSYNSLLARRCRLYHRKIARYLEANPSASRSKAQSNYPLIAHHAYRGQDWRRALHYQFLMGQQARQFFANHEAISHFQKALESAEHLPLRETVSQRQRIHQALGELLTTTAQYDDALTHLQEAYRFAVAHADAVTQARACRWLARLHELRGQYPIAFQWIERGLDILQKEECAESVELLLLAGLIHTRQGHYDQALRKAQRGLEIAQKLDSLTVLARAYNLLGVISMQLGHSMLAINHFQQALSLYQHSGDIYGQATTHNLIATARFYLGPLQEAQHHYRWAHEVFTQIGDVYRSVGVDNNLGIIAQRQGRLDEAQAFYQTGLRALEQVGGSLYMLGVLHNNLGATYIQRREIETARRHLRTSQEYFTQAQARDFLPELHCHFAEAALYNGELAEAETEGQRALNLARELSMRGGEGISLRILGQIAIAQREFDEAEQHLTQSLMLLEDVGDEYEWARSQLVMARLHVLRGNPEAARPALQRALDIFERLDAALDLNAARALQNKITGANAENPHTLPAAI